MKTRQAWFASLTLLAVCCLAGAGRAAPSPERDPKAEEIARAMMRAMGGTHGEDGWNWAPVVRFDFIVKVGGKLELSRSHLWQKRTGRYRLEEKLKGGKTRVALFSVAGPQAYKLGSVYVEGKKLSGPQAEKVLQDAYGAFINDMYWLAMPWKWLDPGVKLRYLGEKTLGNQVCDQVELSFDRVGLTPGDKYRAFVSRKSHLMTHWEYVLEGGDKGAWDWEYGNPSGITLGTIHLSSDRKMSIDMGDVRVLTEVDNAFFTDSTHALSLLK